MNYEVGGKHQFLPTAAVNADLLRQGHLRLSGRDDVRALAGREPGRHLRLPERPLRALQGLRDRDREAPQQLLVGQAHLHVPADQGQEQRPQRAEGGAGGRRRRGRDAPVRDLRALEPPAQARGQLRSALRRGRRRRLGLAQADRRQCLRPGLVGPRVHADQSALDRRRPSRTPRTVRSRSRPTCGSTARSASATGASTSSLAGTNIFNNHIINRVDRVTGEGRVWGVGQYDPAIFARRDRLRHGSSQVDDPSNYGPGAQWRLALDYDF